MTITDPTMQLADAVEQAKSGTDLMVRCPAHEDGTASLHVSPSATGVLLKCHAGCDTKQIIDAVNLEWADLFHEAETRMSEPVWTPAGNASHVYPYTDEYGNVLYEVLRVPQGHGKTFFQRRPSGDPVRPYVWKLEGVRRVLYRLPQIRQAVANGMTIYVPEGEKDVHSLVEHRFEATTNAQGAGKWQEEFTEVLAGAKVIIIQDADNIGRAHGRTVYDSLKAAGCEVAIQEAPAPYKDVTALLEGGGTVDQLLTVVPFHENERPKFGVDVLDIIIRDISAVKWVIPHTLASKERLLLTGLEGHGKSTLLRQMAVMAAAGIHWFSQAEIEPLRALVIDGENEPGQTLGSWQDLIGLAAFHDRPVERGQLIVLEEWDSDIDLASADGTKWLHERIHGYQPQLVLLGPLTNMVGRDLKDDEPVRRLKNTINSARAICGSAFVMEHHAPHKAPGDKKRSIRPYGSSMFLKWPDYGYGMAPHRDQEGVYWWEKFRWPRVRKRAWPMGLRWGAPNTSEWPWVECQPPEEGR